MASSRSSGILNTNTAVFTGHNRLNSVTVFTDGTNAATVTVYDNTSATGTVVGQAISAGATRTTHVQFPNPVYCEVGLYVVVSGIGATGQITYGG